jgi:hypothetical protein
MRLDPGVVLVPAKRRREGRGTGRPRQVRRPHRVHPERVLDVRDEQLLVLLLVVQPELDERVRGVLRVVGDPPHEPAHARVDVRTVGIDLRDRRARDEPALRTAVPLAGLHVVRVEQERVARVERHVPGVVRAEDERLEEPAGVREVPLGRARVGHRADDVVLDRQRLAQRLRLGAHRVVARQQTRGRARVRP